MNVPGLGEVNKDERFGCYYSQPIALAVLNGTECRVVLEGYDEDPNNAEYRVAIENLLSATPSVLKEVEGLIYQYYLDVRSYYPENYEDFPRIASADEVWSLIQLGSEPIVSRRGYGDLGVYVSLECNCDWEPEHGLQIVFKDGNKVCKVGPYDGHLTNSDAFADQTLEHVIYRRLA
ncbi:MAG: hypothetical protein Q8K87_16615 [Hydrogenophaga sp.]|nr:hypothetical protein [Hydrogenophaga sp.]